MATRRGVVGIVVVGLLAAAPIGAARAATIVVDTTADGIDTAGDCSLREAIRAANLDVAVDGCSAGDPGMDTITLPAGHYVVSATGTGEDAALDGDLDVTADLTIIGAGTALSAIEATVPERVFDVQPGIALVLSALEVSDGHEASANGAAVRVGSGGSLTATDCRFYDGQAMEGGGIDGDAATIVLTRVSVSGNEALTGNGGGIHVVGGGLTLEDSAVYSNDGARGGGIYARDAVVILGHTEVSQNSASLEGAGLRVGGASDLTLRNVTVAENQSLGSGGGMLVAAATNALLSNVTIAANVADANDPNGDHGGTGGGVFKSGSGTLTFRNTIIGGNSDEGSAPDCDATLIVSEGHNVVQDATGCEFTPLASDQLGVDPLVESLANNGGRNDTLALGAASPARDAGDPATPGSGGTAYEADDQRGVARPLGAACDVGAFEASPVPTPTPTETGTPVASDTSTPTPAASDTATPAASDTATPTAIDTASVTPTDTPTAAETTTPTPADTPSPSATATPTVTASPTPSTTVPPATATATSAPTTAPTPGCSLVPATGCRRPIAAAKSSLALATGTSDGTHALTWSWTKGGATSKDEFGDPRAATDYAFCLYDATATLVLQARVAPGGVCGRHPCWKETRHGFVLADRDRTPDGIDRVTLAEGLDGHAHVAVSAHGAHLGLPALPLAVPLRVQLQREGGTCWEAIFATPTKNDAHGLKARGE